MKDEDADNKFLREKFFLLDPKKQYLVHLNVPKATAKHDDRQVIANKVALELKASGIKNVTVVPYGIGIHEIDA